jgi:hypothetical protein
MVIADHGAWSRRLIFCLLLATISVPLASSAVAATGDGPERLGYYVFIGKGDHKDEWGPKTPSFSLADWQQLITYLKAKGATTFIPLVTGHRLPYPSQAFPKYIETDSRTTKDVDLQQILDHARASGLEVILAFTTTGHCRFYAQDHPEHCIINEDGSPAPGLCPNRKGAELYPLGIVEEVLRRYKNYDGILIHPPEISPVCYCPDCQRLYKQKTGSDLRSASPVERQRFFVETYLKFAARLLARVDALVPLKVKLMFNCNWMDDHVDLMPVLPKDLDIMYWDYDLRDEYLQGRFRENLTRYLTMNRTIWFMPSTDPRFWTPAKADVEWGCGQVAKQLKIAKDVKIKNIGVFVGSIVYQENIERTVPLPAK